MDISDCDLRGIIRHWIKSTFKGEPNTRRMRIGSSRNDNRFTIKNVNEKVMATYMIEQQKMILFGLSNMSSWQVGSIELADPSFFEKLEKHIRDNFRK